jgi:hypothetical protein
MFRAPVSDDPDRTFFFLHVMKTAGGTLRQQIFANFDREQVYPWERLDPDMVRANSNLEYLTSLPPERRSRLRAFTGHFPFVAVELLGGELTTITLLRDPVERTISYLRQVKRRVDEGRGLLLEDIYEHPYLFPCFIKDHQAKLFAFTPEDEPRSYMDVLDVDADRLEIAKRNLERVDVVGIQDNFESLLSELERRFGWRRTPAPHRNVDPGTPGDISTRFRRRIAEDNPAEMEFFEHARQLVEQRRGG